MATLENTLERDPLILIHDLARLMRTRFDQQARRFGMTRAQWIILIRLERQPGLSQNELAHICEVEPITIGRLIDRLEKQGLVQRCADPQDRRIRRLKLTSEARTLISVIEREIQTMRARLNAGLEASKLNGLADTLLHMKDNLTTEAAGEMKVAAAGE
jgi:DNA-binding MarR family transcriptional regulator